MKPVYLIVGCPGSGKTWVCEQLSECSPPLFYHIAHDDHIKGNYTDALIEAAKNKILPILAEAPFSITQIMEPLEAAGIHVIPVFIIEDPEVVTSRYERREGKDIPKGHLRRQITYAIRAEELGAFTGTSEEVLENLKLLARGR